MDSGKTVSSVANAMRSNPSCLAAIILAAFFALLTYQSMRAERAESHARQLALISRCSFTAPADHPLVDRDRLR